MQFESIWGLTNLKSFERKVATPYLPGGPVLRVVEPSKVPVWRLLA
jgi:hypothetical protein